MYYEDQARRFNLLSGFLVGTVFGAGIGLFSSSVRGIELPARRRKAAGSVWASLRDEARSLTHR